MPEGGLPCQALPSPALLTGHPRPFTLRPMRLAGAVLFATLGTAAAAHADPAPKEVTGDSATSVIVPPAQPLDATAPAPGHAVMWAKIASASDAVAAPLWARV